MLRISLSFRKLNNSRILRNRKVEFSGYCFYMNANIQGNFQIFKHFIFIKIYGSYSGSLEKGGMKLDINTMSSTVGGPSLLEHIALQYNVIPLFCSTQDSRKWVWINVTNN